MTYIKHEWVDDSTPAIDAKALNKIEKGIEDAHTGVEEAKLLANTNTILISATLEFSETEKQYKLPIDDFSFDNYWIFGWCGSSGNKYWTDSSGHSTHDESRGSFEGHKSGTLVSWYDYQDWVATVEIDDDGILTTRFVSYNEIATGISRDIIMCIIPISKKNIIES